MDRARKITALCLAAVFLVTLTVYAATKAKNYAFKVKQNGVNVFIQYTKMHQAAEPRWRGSRTAKTRLFLAGKIVTQKKYTA